MKIRKILLTIGIIGVLSGSLIGCNPKRENTKALNGNTFMPSKGNYVVLNQSGGEIMDCWILKGAYIESEKDSDGIKFTDDKGNGIILQGDVKVIRINNSTQDKYVEYHKETDLIPYDEFYKEHLK